MGAHLDALAHAEKRERLLHLALGVFTSAGMVRLQLHREGDVANVGDLLVSNRSHVSAYAGVAAALRKPTISSGR